MMIPQTIRAVQDATGRLAGLHRTCLRPDGCGKAERGGGVRLLPVGTRLAVCVNDVLRPEASVA
jgi:hypothetical protein